MSLFEKGLTQRQARFVKRACYCAALALVLLVSTMFVSCSDNDSKDVLAPEVLRGTWVSSEHGDSYEITTDKVFYDSLWVDGIDYGGTIRHITVFTETSGVIIISYDDGLENTYQIFDGWDPTGEYYNLSGNFIGIYYRNLIPGTSIEMGTAYMADGDGAPIAEKATLKEAIAAFTAAMGEPSIDGSTYIFTYGEYEKQSE